MVERRLRDNCDIAIMDMSTLPARAATGRGLAGIG